MYKKGNWLQRKYQIISDNHRCLHCARQCLRCLRELRFNRLTPFQLEHNIYIALSQFRGGVAKFWSMLSITPESLSELKRRGYRATN